MKFGVLLMAHGSPDSLDEMEPYLRHVMKRREPTPQFVEEMRGRYRLIGGRSPLLDITRAQAKALEGKLESIPVFVGMRHWYPFIHEVIPEIIRSGVTHLIAIGMTPHYSKMTVEVYHRELGMAIRQQQISLKIIPVKSWNRQPRYIEAWVRNIVAGLAQFSVEVRPQVMVLFTAHSLPEEVLQGGDPYPQEIQETVQGILGHLPNVRWDFAYQSRSPGPEKWLGPDVDSKLKDLYGREVRHVLVVPIGFVCDHVEILYDIDILHRATAERLGLEYRRVESLNTSQNLIEALAEVVRGVMW